MGDDFLGNHISKNGAPGICAYCENNTEDSGTRCLPFDDLMDLVREGIDWAYKSADNEKHPSEFAEDGDIFENRVFDTVDLVAKQIGLDVNEAVLNDVVAALPDHLWCQRDFRPQSFDGALRSGWEGFVDKIKHDTRYLFTIPVKPVSARAKKEPIKMPGPAEVIGDEVPAYRMLEALGPLLESLKLIREVPADTTIFRVRIAKKGLILAGPKDFGPPQRDLAIQPNRMSPAGIVMFYGAMDRKTALAETFEPKRTSANKNVWVASFQAVRELSVLDLTNLPPIPSMFDVKRRGLMGGIDFLHRFVGDLITPIDRRAGERVEYVPTQVVTEYIRHRFRTETNEPLDGILLPSSKNRKGIPCVLFVEQKNCGVPVGPWWEPDQVLRLIEWKTEVLDGAASSDWYLSD